MLENQEAATNTMDDVAAEAKQELLEHLNEWNAREVAAWWGKWYSKAGHKRLGRVLVAITKK